MNTKEREEHERQAVLNELQANPNTWVAAAALYRLTSVMLPATCIYELRRLGHEIDSRQDVRTEEGFRMVNTEYRWRMKGE